MSDCPHITCALTDEGKICKRCGAHVEEALRDDPDYHESALEGLAASRARARERMSLDHRRRNREVANEKELGSPDDSWLGGKLVPHLDPRDPDRMVTSERQMRRVYDKNGISMDTGEVVDQEKYDKRLREVRKKNRKPGWNKPQPGTTLQKSKK